MRWYKRMAAVCVVLLCVSSCSHNHLPDYAPDIVSMAYKKMNKITTFRSHSIMEMTVKRQENEERYKREVTTVSFSDPREITVQLKKGEGEEEEESYLYYDEDLSKENAYELEGGRWVEASKEVMEPYESVVPFGTYFAGTDSFTKLASEQGSTILQGTVEGSNVVYALKESGVLAYFSLTTMSEELAKKLSPVKVKVWIDQRNNQVTRMEADMTETLHSFVRAFYTEHLGPDIGSCIYRIESIKVGEPAPLPLPKGTEEALRDALAKRAE